MLAYSRIYVNNGETVAIFINSIPNTMGEPGNHRDGASDHAQELVLDKQKPPEPVQEYRVDRISPNWGYAMVPINHWRRLEGLDYMEETAGGDPSKEPRPHLITMTPAAEAVVHTDAFVTQYPEFMAGEIYDPLNKKWVLAYRFQIVAKEKREEVVAQLEKKIDALGGSVPKINVFVNPPDKKQ